MKHKSSCTLSLVLGTAQLGMKYGIANRAGQPDSDVAEAMVAAAWENGIHEFDTAQAYGTSEAVLGRVLHNLGLSANARIISKPHPEIDHLKKGALTESLERSLNNLNISKIHGLMLHSEKFLESWEEGVGANLMDLVRQGLVQHLGISVYSPDKALSALETEGISFIQIPTNILDHRFWKKQVFELAQEKCKTIYVRSVFLQGLLLMDSRELPKSVAFASPVLRRIESLCRELQMTKLDLALGFVKKAFPRAKVVFGAERPEQVFENTKSWREDGREDIVEIVENEFNDIEDTILNPNRWPEALAQSATALSSMMAT